MSEQHDPLSLAAEALEKAIASKKQHAEKKYEIEVISKDNLPDKDDPAIQALVKKCNARIRQLRFEIESRKEENNVIVAENLKQNEELRLLNEELDHMVNVRTEELEMSKMKLEEQNLELQGISESKEAMMHMIVHDMKNPLTSVMGALCLSQNPQFEIDATLKDLLNDAHIQSIKLRTMIDDILTMSKMRSKELTLDTMEVDLVSLAQQSVLLMNTVKGDKNLSIVFNPSVKEVEVSMDFQMIERVINNILNNAIKYAPKDSELLMDVNLDGDYAKLSITDWGKGIPKAHHQKIFELFSRVDPNDKVIQGTGLGLAFCKLAIEAHLGEIFVESPVPDHDCGSRFSFKLPLSSKIEAAKKNS